MSDKARIKFLINREGDYQKVIDFAIQARGQYRKAVLSAKEKYGKRHEFRKRYIESYLFHRKFINENMHK